MSSPNQAHQSDSKPRLNPKTWTKKTRIVSICVALVLVLAGVGGGFAYRQYKIGRDCEIQVALFNDQKPDLEEAVKEGYGALESVDASFVAGSGRPLMHTDDFSVSVEGEDAIAELGDVLSRVEKHSNETAPSCSNGSEIKSLEDLNVTRQTDMDALKANTASFKMKVEEYRLARAAAVATQTMETAKSDLAVAQRDAIDQLAIVDADSDLQGSDNIRAAYDALKALESDSHSISTDISTGTYEEAVASIGQADVVSAKAAEISAATQALKVSIQAYNETKAAQAAAEAAAQAAQAAREQHSRIGSSYSGGSQSGGSSNRAPAPAPAPAPASGQLPIPEPDLNKNFNGCIWMEGNEYCG